MKYLLIILCLVYTLCPAQSKVKTETRAYFSFQSGSGTKYYFQKGKYEIYKDVNDKIGIRNIPTGVPLVRPQLYSAYTINDTAYSTVDSVILKLKLNIYR